MSHPFITFACAWWRFPDRPEAQKGLTTIRLVDDLIDETLECNSCKTARPLITFCKTALDPQTGLRSGLSIAKGALCNKCDPPGPLDLVFEGKHYRSPAREFRRPDDGSPITILHKSKHRWMRPDAEPMRLMQGGKGEIRFQPFRYRNGKIDENGRVVAPYGTDSANQEKRQTSLKLDLAPPGTGVRRKTDGRPDPKRPVRHKPNR